MYQSDLKVVPELSQGCPKVVTISFRVVLKCCNAGSRGLIPFYIVCQPCKKFNSQRVIKSTRGLNASSTASGRSIYPRPNQRTQGRTTGVGVGVPTQCRTNVRCCAATWLVLASVWSVDRVWRQGLGDHTVVWQCKRRHRVGNSMARGQIPMQSFRKTGKNTDQKLAFQG